MTAHLSAARTQTTSQTNIFQYIKKSPDTACFAAFGCCALFAATIALAKTADYPENLEGYNISANRFGFCALGAGLFASVMSCYYCCCTTEKRITVTSTNNV